MSNPNDRTPDALEDWEADYPYRETLRTALDWMIPELGRRGP